MHQILAILQSKHWYSNIYLIYSLLLGSDNSTSSGSLETGKKYTIDVDNIISGSDFSSESSDPIEKL